jgi:hypothetical protein
LGSQEVVGLEGLRDEEDLDESIASNVVVETLSLSRLSIHALHLLVHAVEQRYICVLLLNNEGKEVVVINLVLKVN